MKSPEKVRRPSTPRKPIRVTTAQATERSREVEQAKAALNEWFEAVTAPLSAGASPKDLYRMMVEGTALASSSVEEVYTRIAAALNRLYPALHILPAHVRKHVEIRPVYGGLLLDSLFYWSTGDEPQWKTRKGIRVIMEVMKQNAPFVLLQDEARKDGFLIRLYKFFLLKASRKDVSFFDDCSYYKHFGFQTTPDFKIDHIRSAMDAALNRAVGRGGPALADHVAELETIIAHIPHATFITPKKLFVAETVNLMD